MTRIASGDHVCLRSTGPVRISRASEGLHAFSSLYAATANGTFDLINANPLANDAGDTLLKLSPSNLAILGFFTPSNVFTYNNNLGLCEADQDGSGVMSALVEVRSR